MTRGNGLARVVKATIVVGALAMSAVVAQAQVVLYSDFGAGQSFSAGNYGFSGSFAIGAQFQPSTTALFQDAILALGTGGAPTGTVSVYLYTDAGNLPGTLIEQLTGVSVTNIPAALTAYSTLHPLLFAGTSYWLVVADPSGYRWYESATGVDNTSTNFVLNATFPSNTSWTNVFGGDKAPAYEIDGITTAGSGAPFQIRYVSHLDIGDSVINITNDGQTAVADDAPGILTSASNLCVGVYTFDANEELQSCCACLVTPNGLASLSAQAINSTGLTGENPSSLVVKLLAWSTTAGASSTAPPGTPAPPTSSTCNPAMPGTPSGGMHAWGTTVHALPVGGPSTYTVTETESSPGNLSAAEYAHITQSCEFNQINGSDTSGQCKGCASGGQ